MTLKLIYQDEHFIAINKPQKLLSVPGLSQPENLFDQVRALFPNARTVHRLDMATSGLILFALNHPAQKNINRQFEHKTVRKSYCAIVEGQVRSRFGEISAPLAASTLRKTRHDVNWPTGKVSHTHYECIAQSNRVSRLRLTPVTGRSHQLRVHCLYLGHPIVGDAFYGDEFSANRLMLHAETLGFMHPYSSEPIQLLSPCPF